MSDLSKMLTRDEQQLVHAGKPVEAVHSLRSRTQATLKDSAQAVRLFELGESMASLEPMALLKRLMDLEASVRSIPGCQHVDADHAP